MPGRVGGRSFSDFEYDHPEVTEGEAAVSEGGSEAVAASRAGRSRPPAALPGGAIDWNRWRIFGAELLRDGGTAMVEGTLPGSAMATVKYDGRINSPTRGQLFVAERTPRGDAKPWRAMTEAEKRGMLATVEREIAKNDPDISPRLAFVLDRLKSGKAIGAAPGAGAAAGVKDLGHLPEPGKKLAGKTSTLKPGESLRFTTSENQIRGLGTIKVTPAGALKVTRKVIERPPPGMLGGMSKVEYTITVPKAAKAGTTAKLSTGGHHQVRNDPHWAFTTSVKVGKK